MRAKAQVGLYGQVGPRRGREDYPAVYLPQGQVTHLLDPMRSPNGGAPALCGRSPVWYDNRWRGTGSEDEYDQARAMPLCVRCAEMTRVEEAT